MRKLWIFAVVALFGLAAQAQGHFNAGLSGGIPVGDAGDFATFAIAVDLGYLFEINDSFEAGVATGYSHSFGDDVEIAGFTVEVDDVQFIPIAAAARFDVAPSFTLGADVGYAIGINDGNDGGFYYVPSATYNVNESWGIMGAFRGISKDGGSWNLITLGAVYTFGAGSSDVE
ncbi:outer membrane beta-barrel protein [Aureitalea marina]|uniref:Outer membrane protein beta-barrel domain-containing protein n=1 Tax=Aureitalea marina TaxID=930804 RepID=A0A2S7KNX7_9FLAO|nr:outer membrane beta-barrel protein [Aureitalea marina]PQB04288.1 hypothetical protein BST85_04770 [Aureitalea marina]